MLHHFSSYLKGRWEEWTQVISRTLGNRGKLKRGAWRRNRERGRSKEGGGRPHTGKVKRKRKRQIKWILLHSTIEFFSARYATDFWECKVTRH